MFTTHSSPNINIKDFRLEFSISFENTGDTGLVHKNFKYNSSYNEKSAKGGFKGINKEVLCCYLCL